MTNPITMNPDSRILITGGTGLVGHALSQLLADEGYSNVISVGSRDCDLRNNSAVSKLFSDESPDYVFHLAARVHGIGGNTLYKYDVLYENVLINTNVIDCCRRSGVKKIVAMGSGCVYPELPTVELLTEDLIWDGPPHSSEDSYAHAKRLMLAQLDAAKKQYSLASAFAISGNLFGPHDNFNIEEGHVTPSLVAKFFEAARIGGAVKVWGSGRAIRDFTYSEDVARALMVIMEKIEGPVNMGSGFQHPIADIVSSLSRIVGDSVSVEWDVSKPDGQLKRYYKLDKLENSGFTASVTLDEGIRRTYEWYAENWQQARR